jgi:hypothetical protein
MNVSDHAFLIRVVFPKIPRIIKFIILGGGLNQWQNQVATATVAVGQGVRNCMWQRGLD